MRTTIDTITEADADELDSLAEMHDMTLRDDYSGRGMYGERCFGITYWSSSAWDVAKYLMAALGQDRAFQIMDSHHMDSMGRDYIHYFPGVVVEDGVEFLHNDDY